jgi:hypothetical protein
LPKRLLLITELERDETLNRYKIKVRNFHIKMDSDNTLKDIFSTLLNSVNYFIELVKYLD